jgi:GNAT superfamily N-acetyltransferase
MIAVRRATPADKRAIFDFVHLAYPNRAQYRVPDRWEWEFERNPFRAPDQLPVFIAVDEGAGRVVGQSCAMPARLWLRGETRSMAWGVDSYVLPEYRGTGLGTALQKLLFGATDVFMSLNVSAVNQRIKARLGSVALRPVLIFNKLLRFLPERVAERGARAVGLQNARATRGARRVIRLLAADRVATALLNRRLAYQDRRRRPPEDPLLQVETVGAIGDEFDELWSRVSPSLEAAVVRDAAYLRWKFVSQPFMHYVVLGARRRGTLAGYAVLRRCRPPEPPVGVIADVLTDPGDRSALETMLAFAVDYLRREGVTQIEAATSLPAYERALRKLGFDASGQMVPMFHARPAGHDQGSGGAAPNLLLGRADSDWDQFPLRSVCGYANF